MLKPLAIAGLRVALALLLIIWGLVRLGAPAAGMGVSNKYYGGLGANMMVQTAWGSALVLIGLFCLIGWQRRYALAAQAVVLVSGALVIWKYLLDPLGLWLLTRETSQILFFPSLSMAFASLLLLTLMEEDRWSLDNRLKRRR
jgi:putative oxidoreductase